jgi:hypothetical protein
LWFSDRLFFRDKGETTDGKDCKIDSTLFTFSEVVPKKRQNETDCPMGEKRKAYAASSCSQTTDNSVLC